MSEQYNVSGNSELDRDIGLLIEAAYSTYLHLMHSHLCLVNSVLFLASALTIGVCRAQILDGKQNSLNQNY